MMILVPMLVLFSAAPPEIAATATADHTAIRLSESLRVTLSVEGPAPLRIDLTESIPDEQSAIVWRVRPVGPARSEQLPNQRERWSREFRADPFAVGQPLTLSFAPATVRFGTDPRPHTIDWPPLEVAVTSSLTNPTPDDIRPITGIEPVAIPNVEESEWPRVTIAAIVIGLTILGIFVLLRSRYFETSPVQPIDRIRAQLQQLNTAPLNSREFADQLSQCLRQGIEDLTTVPATQRTSLEIQHAPDLVARPDSLRTALTPIFDKLDGALYANHDLTQAEREELLHDVGLVLSTLAAPSHPARDQGV